MLGHDFVVGSKKEKKVDTKKIKTVKHSAQHYLEITNDWGLVGSALLLAGGIVALVYKNKPPRYNPDTGELIQ